MCGRAALGMQMTIGDDVGGASLWMSPNQPYTVAVPLCSSWIPTSRLPAARLGSRRRRRLQRLGYSNFPYQVYQVRSLITRVATL